MRVLVLAHSYPRFADDPVGSFVLRLAVALKPLGVEVRVLAPSGDGLPPRDTFEGVAVERFRYAPRALETLAYSGTMADQVKSSFGARAAMASLLAAQALRGLRSGSGFKPDLVHAHWFFPGGLVGSWLAGWWDVPLVTTLHGSDLRLARRGGLASRTFRRVMRRSTTVTTVSNWLASGTRALVPEVNAVVAPMPVLPDLFHAGGQRERNRVLFVGKLNPQKGITHLLRALPLMRTTPAVDIVVGVGSAPEDIQHLVDELGVAGQLVWHPLLKQAELARLYREATVLAAPFVDEGLGLVAIESQLSGQPVVAFRSGGLTDVVVHEKTGLLVEPGDPAGLAAALDRVLALPDAGAAWGAAGRAHALAEFAPDAVARKYLDIYRAALERRP